MKYVTQIKCKYFKNKIYVHMLFKSMQNTNKIK